VKTYQLRIYRELNQKRSERKMAKELLEVKVERLEKEITELKRQLKMHISNCPFREIHAN
jgi:uncharacterized protein YceH (UPF0502 family)